MKIPVKDENGYTLCLVDNQWRCLHATDSSVLEIEPPCCNGSDCACKGLYGVYCHLCDNDDLSDDDINNKLDELEDYYE